MPCVSSSDCLSSPLLFPSSLLFPWTRHTHTHTHTHINTGNTSTHVYTITGLIQRHKHIQGTQVFQELKAPCPALLEMVSGGTMSCPGSSLSTSSLSISIFSEGSLKKFQCSRCGCVETPIGGCVNPQKIPKSAHRFTGTLDRTPLQ